MTANELFRAGKLKEAIQAATAEVKDNPLDTKRRSLLFELLCFGGDFDRAGKQLEVLGQGGQQAELGALLLRAAIHSERERQEFFTKKAYADLAAPAEPAGRAPRPCLARESQSDFRCCDHPRRGRLSRHRHGCSWLARRTGGDAPATAEFSVCTQPVDAAHPAGAEPSGQCRRSMAVSYFHHPVFSQL